MNNELKFRNIITQVLGRENVSYIAMSPRGYRQGEINLLYHMNKFIIHCKIRICSWLIKMLPL